MADEASRINLRAAIYMRASTEYQNYSIENQTACLYEYAHKHHIDIVQVYRDDAQSGLTIKRRPALIRLITDIENYRHDFEILLIYDVSRWGRFQDVDESAHYEYICRRNGILLEYCAEPFENDGTSISSILKNMKRVMAAEYSRELSAKVFRGQVNLIKHGYMHGGATGYGYRRMLVDKNNNHKQILEAGQRKNINTDRTVLVLGPLQEVQTVKEIYRLYIKEKIGPTKIAKILRLRDKGAAVWTYDIVKKILTDQKYIGNTVFNRSSNKLQRGAVPNPDTDWVICKNTHTAIIDEKTFWKAQDLRARQTLPVSDEKLLSKLTKIYKDHGKVTAKLIDQTYGQSANLAFYKRFGDLMTAYELAGYTPMKRQMNSAAHRLLFRHQIDLTNNILKRFAALGISVEFRPNFVIRIGGNIDVIVRVMSTSRQHRKLVWKTSFHHSAVYDFVIFARIEPRSEEILDYHVFNAIDPLTKTICMRTENKADFRCRQQNTLDSFYEKLTTILRVSDPYEPPVLISRPDVLKMTNLSSHNIIDRVKAGRFPKPIRLAYRYAAWIRSDIDIWFKTDSISSSKLLSCRVST